MNVRENRLTRVFLHRLNLCFNIYLCKIIPFHIQTDRRIFPMLSIQCSILLYFHVIYYYERIKSREIAHSWLRYDLTSMLIPNRTVWSRWKALMTENLMGPTPKSSHITTPQAGSLALPKQPTCSAQNCHRCNSTTRYYKNRQFLHNFGIFDNFMAISPY